MPSGKQSKRQRRAPTPPVRTGASRRASPRVLIAVGGAIVVAIVAVVLGFALTGGSSSSTTSVPERGSLVNALPGAAHVQSLLEGIPQHGNVLGSPTAPVTMAVYVDLQCPYCREFELDAMPKLLDEYVRTGKARVDLRPMAFIGPDSVSGRAAAIAAADQNKLFNFAQLLFLSQGAENTGWLDEKMVVAAAASIPGLDVQTLLDARNSSAGAASAAGFDNQASDDSVDSTPTILVGRTGGPLETVTLASPTDGESVSAAIQSLLGG
jgi:protein-disulfide isomerase